MGSRHQRRRRAYLSALPLAERHRAQLVVEAHLLRETVQHARRVRALTNTHDRNNDNDNDVNTSGGTECQTHAQGSSGEQSQASCLSQSE